MVSRDNFTKASPPAELLAARVSSIGGSGRAGSFQENHGKGRSARRHPSIAAVNAPGMGAVTLLYAAESFWVWPCFSRISIIDNIPHRNVLPSVVSAVAATLYQSKNGSRVPISLAHSVSDHLVTSRLPASSGTASRFGTSVSQRRQARPISPFASNQICMGGVVVRALCCGCRCGISTGKAKFRAVLPHTV